MSEMDKDILDKKEKYSNNKNERLDKEKSVQKKTADSRVKNDYKVNTSKSNNSNKRNDGFDKKKSVQKKTADSQVKNDYKVNTSKSNNSNKRKRKRKKSQAKELEENIKKENSNKEKNVSTTQVKKKNNQISEINNVRSVNVKDLKELVDKNDNKKSDNVKLNNGKNNKIKESNLKKKFKIIIIIIIIIIFIFFLVGLYLYGYKIHQDKIIRENDEQKRLEIASYYNQYVKTNKVVDIYKLDNDKYIKIGKIGMNEELVLEEKDMFSQDGYFKIVSLDEDYYVYYKDIEYIDNLDDVDLRYKKYILYNKNIVTNDVTSFYDIDDNLVYTFNKSFDMPIIVNKKDIYGVEYNNRLLYVKKEDVKEIRDNNNTDLKNTNGIAVLNYHFFYDETKVSERNDCSQIICHSKSGVRKHFEYIKNNNIFTPTMKEFEMYLDKEINLPKSVLITIDDGWRTQIVEELLEEYQLNGTIFLITSWFKEIDWLNNSEYIEYHSHGDNLHNQGVCSGGQGGAIQCLEKNKLLKDLNLSREKLADTTAFCYPFYEYNSYSISVLKEAGFTLAFAGGFKKATVNVDKYQIPRYVMYDYTTVNDLKSYIN